MIVAVSGTIETGFELRSNIDWPGCPAVDLGLGLCRGAKMFFDVKDVGSREYDPKRPSRVNPAMVLTGDDKDANLYSIFLVDERACMKALLGEPRYLSMAPDALRIDLESHLTSPRVKRFAQSTQCAVLSVVSCFKSRRFVEAPPFVVLDDGTRVTNFKKSIAIWAGVDEACLGTSAWDDAVATTLRNANLSLPPREALYASDASFPRLQPRRFFQADVERLIRRSTCSGN